MLAQTTAGLFLCPSCDRYRSILRRRRGICRTCYHTPAIRRRYRQTGTLAGLEGQSTRDRDRLAPAPFAPDPTAAEPGSPHKLAVMELRRAQGYSLFRPDDAPLTPGARTGRFEQFRRKLRSLFRLRALAEALGGVHPCEDEGEG